MIPRSLRQRLDERAIIESRVVRASALAARDDVARLAREESPGGTVMTTCRNGVFRSTMLAATLEAEGVPVVSKGTHTGQSYESLLERLRDPATAAGPDGLRLAGVAPPVDLLLLCVDDGSADELTEIEPILDWLAHFASGPCRFRLVVIDGPEEHHEYY